MNVVALVLRAGLRDLARNRWIAAYAAGILLITEGLFWFGGTSAQVTLSLLNVVLLVVPLVSLVFGTIHIYASREFVELLLAQPVQRRSLFAGLYLGLALPLSAALVAGVGVPLAFHAVQGGVAASGVGALVALLGVGVGLTLAFSAVATWLALLTDDRLKGVGAALGVWLFATIIYDGLVLGVTVVMGDYPIERPLLGMMLANPVDIARVLVVTQLDAAALLGYTGALFNKTFGTMIGTAVGVTALVAWCAGPLVGAAKTFASREW